MLGVVQIKLCNSFSSCAALPFIRADYKALLIDLILFRDVFIGRYFLMHLKCHDSEIFLYKYLGKYCANRFVLNCANKQLTLMEKLLYPCCSSLMGR